MEFLKDLAASLRSARTVELPDGNQLYCQHYLLLHFILIWPLYLVTEHFHFVFPSFNNFTKIYFTGVHSGKPFICQGFVIFS